MLSLSHVAVLCHVIILLGLGLQAFGQRQIGSSWRERMRQLQLLQSNPHGQASIPAPTATASIELREQRIIEEMTRQRIPQEQIPQEQKKQRLGGKRRQKRRVRKQKKEEKRLRKQKQKEQRQKHRRLKTQTQQKPRLGKKKLKKQRLQKQSQAAHNPRQERRLQKQRLKKQRQEERRLQKQRLKEQRLREQILREQIPSDSGHTFVDQFATNTGEALGGFNPGAQLQPFQTSHREPLGGGQKLDQVGSGHWLDSSLSEGQPIVNQLATNSGEPLGAVNPGEQLQPLQTSTGEPLGGGVFELDQVGSGQFLDSSLGESQPIVDKLATNSGEPMGAVNPGEQLQPLQPSLGEPLGGVFELGQVDDGQWIDPSLGQGKPIEDQLATTPSEPLGAINPDDQLQPLQPLHGEPLGGGKELGPVGDGQWLDPSLGAGLPVTAFKDVDLGSNAGQSPTGGIEQSVKQPSTGIQTVNGGFLPKTEIPRESAFTSSIQTKTSHNQIFKTLSGLSSKLKTA